MITKTLQDFSKLLTKDKPLIAIDYGQRKTGFAISNQERTIAMPLKTIYDVDDKSKIEFLLTLTTNYSACGIIVGMPFNLDGNLNPQTTIILKFCQLLEIKTNLPIYLQDERFTSKAADNMLKTLGFNRHKRTQKDDAIAASLILETVLTIIKKIPI